jgi:hypothetical protein
MKSFIYNTLIICSCLTTNYCLSQESSTTTEEPVYYNNFSLLFDQDFLGDFLGLNDDRNYTQGLGFDFTCNKLRKLFDKKFRLKYPSDNVLNFPTKVTFQFAGFTPNELRDSLPIIGDRPYSSVVFLSLKDYRVDQEKFKARFWVFYIGVLGIPGVAECLQTSIHKLNNKNNTVSPYNPEGWHNQISQGGEPTAMVSYGEKRLLTRHTIEEEANNGEEKYFRGCRQQVVSNFQVDLGYITQFNYGIDFRFGSINLKKWHEDAQWSLSGTQNIVQPTNKKNYYSQIKNNKELYFFAGMRAGLMIYNASLHGQFKQTNYRLPYEDTGFFTNTGRIGIAYNCSCFGFTIYGAYKSSELMTSYSRIHTWGGFTVNFKWK